MAQRPRERIVYTIELYDKTVAVKAFYYQGDEMAAATGQKVPVAADEAAHPGRLADLLDCVDDLRGRVTAWARQIPLF